MQPLRPPLHSPATAASGRPTGGKPKAQMRAVPAGNPRVSAAVARAKGLKPAETPVKRDPAPSRAAYRMNRLWLTPTFRIAMRFGLPALLTFGVVSIYFAQGNHRESFMNAIADVRQSIESRPEFRVSTMLIEGASPELEQDIREAVVVDFPTSSFDLDLPAMLEQIRGLDAVAEASLQIRSSGVLGVDITERQPAIVWRGPQGLEVLDALGHRVAALGARGDRPDLPLVAGQGAQDAVQEALEVLAIATPVAGRLRGLERMGERRWDVVLDRDQRILLPEEGAAAAMEQVMALDRAQDVLGRDVTAVDMRNIHRPTLRLSEAAMADMRRIKGLDTGDAK
ncbi:Cell division protein FtsQ [Aquimixticola soesokkakensis]|uniref:Cell division protein FtsQ n=1 Tax=Aquimixticola soesokkakensis TaxID=1519096 RepID=A0A1Y5S9F7_9RHOB|nr:cell division protein FtsQ/DivIB [Aquimixticola soesokkakensis]SLN35224.1 Cell division protein FtsQ [Aquimixticola soesokkakensis]